MASFSPDDTRDGELPPWEVAKAYAFKIVLDKVAETLGRPASKLVGGPVSDYIASQSDARCQVYMGSEMKRSEGKCI